VGKGGLRRSRLLIGAVVLVLALTLGVTLASAVAPTVSIENATAVQASTAHVKGKVDPGGKPTTYRFQAATQADFSDAVPGPEATIEGADQTVEGDFGGLVPNTTYHLRLVAENEDGTDEAVAASTFTTEAVTAPTVLSVNDATNVTITRAKVSGSVQRPAGPDDPAVNVNCRFEYVSQLDFGARDEQQKVFVRGGAGNFAFVFNGKRTYELPFDATPAEIDTALETLTTVGAGNVTVSGGPGDEVASTPYLVTFVGALGGQDVPELGVDGTELIGPNHGAFVQTVGEGHGIENFNRAVPAPCNVDPLKTPGVNNVETELSGLLPNMTYHFRLTAENAGGTDTEVAANTFTTDPPVAPTATITGVNNITTTSADVTSTVNPNGTATTGVFEVSADGGATWIPTPSCYCFTIGIYDPNPVELGDGTAPVPFDRTLREPPAFVEVLPSPPLEPNTIYLVRLRAVNAGGVTVTPNTTFKTGPVPPRAQTLGAEVTATEAKLGGKVNSRKGAVTYQFEWGLKESEGDSSYEKFAPATPQAFAFADDAFHNVITPLSGLQPNTAYHYRIAVHNTETDVEVKGADISFKTLTSVPPPPACPNEASRVGAAAGLPDCRAYEWVTPDLGGVTGLPQAEMPSLADGSAIRFRVDDAPEDAEGANVGSSVVSRRGPDGWHSRSLAPQVNKPLEGFYPSQTDGLVSSDFSEALVWTTIPLTGDRVPGEMNLYLRKADGSYVPISLHGNQMQQDFQWSLHGAFQTRASADLSRIFFSPVVKQFPGDPQPGEEGNVYEWFNGQLELIGYLPPATVGGPEVLVPEGVRLTEGALPAVSESGDEVLFRTYSNSPPGLFLRLNGTETVEVSATERATGNEDPNPVGQPTTVGITADGSTVYFISKSELTEDANTGETGGLSTDAGADLYAYDVATGDLTDLTVADNPADALTGANVTGVAAATKDGSYIYFTATGNLAPGGLSGQANLYVYHDGEISFVASGAGFVPDPYLTPNGLHLMFASSATVTGYDNAGFREIYKYDYEAGVQCISCRPSGEPPTGDAVLPRLVRSASDDGSRYFFNSSDAILPEATNGQSNPYEYSNGEINLLSPGDAEVPVSFVSASASGDDVFLATHEELIPGVGRVFAIYDARVNAETTVPTPPVCSGENCLGSPTTPPTTGSPGTGTFEAPTRVSGSATQSVSGAKAAVRVIVPGPGQVTVSGKGLKGSKRTVSAAGSVSVTVKLAPGANKTRLKKGKFRTKARVVFKPSSGETSVLEVAMTFKGAAKKGGK
jgi:hypothetical protein